MKKRPTDFSQISLLSNQKAKLIILKNSIENNEHAKLCKSLELAKRGMGASHRKTKKDLERRLERHYQDTLNFDDIKSLRKYVGDDAEDESEFCSHFESGRRRSTSFSYNRKGYLYDCELADLERRRSFSENQHRETGSMSSKLQDKARTNYSKQDEPQWKENDGFDSGTSAECADVWHNNRSRTCPEATTDAQSTIGSPKAQRNITSNNSENHSEMLSMLTMNSAKPDVVPRRTRSDLEEHSQETAIAEVNASKNVDENNNSMEKGISVRSGEENALKLKAFGSDNQNKKVSDTAAARDCTENSYKVSSESNEIQRNKYSQVISENQRQDLKKGIGIRKRLGPTPKECDEVDGEMLQNENNATETQYPVEQTASVIQVNNERSSVEKHREIFSSSNVTVTRRRSCSWAGRSTTERYFKRSELTEGLPHVSKGSEYGNAAVTHAVLENWDGAGSSRQKPCEITTDVSDLASIAAEYLMPERRQGCENVEEVKNKTDHGGLLHKAESVPVGLATQGIKVYSEEPFYIRPRRLSRRISWQSSKLSEETLKGLQAIADQAKNDTETLTDEPDETPLVRILPPIKLQSIYAQQCSKEKREQELSERKQRGTHKKIEERKKVGLDLLTERLRDCRYLRLKKDPS